MVTVTRMFFSLRTFFAYQIETSRSDAGRGLWLKGDGTGVLKAVPGHESGVEVYGEQRGVAAADFDSDGRMDLVVSQNGAPTKLYRNVGGKPGLSLKDVAVGQVRVKYRDGSYGPLRESTGGRGLVGARTMQIFLVLKKNPKILNFIGKRQKLNLKSIGIRIW